MKHLVSIILILLGAFILVSGFLPQRPPAPYDLAAYGRTPVQFGTRTLPLDSVARNTLRLLSGRTALNLPASPEFPEGLRFPAIEWFLELSLRPEVADHYPVFSVSHDELLGILGREQKGSQTFSFRDLQPHLDEIVKSAQAADDKKDAGGSLSPFDTEVSRLRDNIMLYQRVALSFVPPGNQPAADWKTWQASLKPGTAALQARDAGHSYDESTFNAFLLQTQRYMQISSTAIVGLAPPPAASQNGGADAWLNLGQIALSALRSGQLSPVLGDYTNLGASLRAGDPDSFNAAVTSLHRDLGPAADSPRIHFEVFINQVEPFFRGAFLYILAFVCACLSWVTLGPQFRRAAFWLVVFGFALQTFGLFARVYLTGFGIVTSLYSSALFVGWIAVLFGLVIELWRKNALGVAMASFVGFATLVIAHSIPFNGDDLEMPRAVLATNFWLWTHVLCITSGYGAMFAAGALGLGYIFAGTFLPGFTPARARELARLVYGITCFATLFSFVGTMLGGIWADQSWGRFWGWDPKENGALLIVLWCAICLHARWGKLCSERTQMALAVGGNIVTAWSWFGVNLLGVGLHSYGFIQGTFLALILFCLSQLAVIILAFLPIRPWRSQLPQAQAAS